MEQSVVRRRLSVEARYSRNKATKKAGRNGEIHLTVPSPFALPFARSNILGPLNGQLGSGLGIETMGVWAMKCAGLRAGIFRSARRGRLLSTAAQLVSCDWEPKFTAD